jgi:hypothetical protein
LLIPPHLLTPPLLQSVSACTSGHIKRYLLDGVLPDKHTPPCPIDEGFFPGAKAASLGPARSVEEDELLAIARRASDRWTDWLATGRGE